MDRRVTPSERVTSPTWGPPPPCKLGISQCKSFKLWRPNRLQSQVSQTGKQSLFWFKIGLPQRKSLSSRSLFSVSLQTFCLTVRAYLNTQKYGLFCSLQVSRLAGRFFNSNLSNCSEVLRKDLKNIKFIQLFGVSNPAPLNLHPSHPRLNNR